MRTRAKVYGKADLPATDWRAGFWAGVIAGIADELLLWAAMLAQGMSPLAAAPMGAAILLGPGVLQSPPTAGIVAASMAVHFAIAIACGLVLAAVIGRAARGPGLLLGIAFGLAVWFVNYFVIAPAAFPWFVPMRSMPLSPLLHAAFGLIAAGAYLALRRGERRDGLDRRMRARSTIIERRGFDDRRRPATA